MRKEANQQLIHVPLSIPLLLSFLRPRRSRNLSHSTLQTVDGGQAS